MRRVSVIIPTFNQAEYLPETIESVLSQEGVDVEVIVVNDGSTDETEKVLEGYGGKITVISQPNTGVPGALNAGLERASCDWVSWIASDNVFCPSALKRLLDVAEGHDIAYADQVEMDETLSYITHKKLLFPYSFERVFCDDRNWAIHLSISFVYRKSLHRAAGWYDPAFTNVHDFEMFLRFAKAGGRFVYAPETLIKIRSHVADGRRVHQRSPEGMRRHDEQTRRIIQAAMEWRASRRLTVVEQGARHADVIVEEASGLARRGCLQEAVELVPNDVGEDVYTLVRLGWFLDRLGLPARAVELFSKALKLDPERVECAQFLWLYSSLGMIGGNGAGPFPLAAAGHAFNGRVLDGLKKSGSRRVFVIGHGLTALEASCYLLREGFEISAYCDTRREHAWGKFLGEDIAHLSGVGDYPGSAVLAAVESKYHGEVREAIAGTGRESGVIFV
ncbi:MAG: glycosyltransferase [Candidatus Nitrospinota bacterium M3_3B_026]